MIAPIPPVTPVPAATPVAPVAQAAPAPAPQTLVDRFSALMQQIGHGPGAQTRTHGPSQLSRMVDAENHAARATLENIQSFSIGDAASMPEMAVAAVQMQSEMAVLSFKLNIVNTLAESGKTAVQTLMKNQ
jgi:type III secretion inner rod protein HrpB2